MHLYLVVISSYQVHKAALNHPGVQDILYSDKRWDLVVASPLFNELGVMLGKENSGHSAKHNF